jgi:uncharacterized protein
MSERDGYEPGVPCRVAAVEPDPGGAASFYGVLFGSETDTFDTGGGAISVGRVPGYVGGEPQQPASRDVVRAMLSGDEHDGAPPPHWEVRFWIADADAAAEKAAAMGGSVVAGPYDVPGFRQAVLADPQCAAFTASQLMIASQGA